MRRGHAFITTLLVLFLAAPAGATWENWDWASLYDTEYSAAGLEVCSDGQGGMIAAICASPGPTLPITLQHVDATGNELWGGGEGVAVPILIGEDSHGLPIDLCLDGAGGAFVAYRRTIAAHPYLYVSRVDAEGLVTWTVPVGDFVDEQFTLDVRIVDVGGAAIVLWTEYNAYPNLRLVAARVEGDGTVAWTQPVGAGFGVSMDLTAWNARPDGAGGVLVGWNHQPFGGNFEGRAQRIDYDGNALWGANGVQLWTNSGSVIDVLSDGGGGAYVMNSVGWGESWLQHVGSGGVALWAAGGQKVLDLGTFSMNTRPSLCGDGLGGCFVVDGLEDLYAQHVDLWGTMLWGTGLQLTTLPGWQHDGDLMADGFGGFLVCYVDHYLSEIGDSWARALSTKRFDYFGVQTWEMIGTWWSIPVLGSGYVPERPQLVSDYAGGALVAWQEYGQGTTHADALATGISYDGEVPASPRLTVITPDAGAPEELLPVTVIGNYLEPAQDFRLVGDGFADIALDMQYGVSSAIVEGTADLAGAEAGPRQLWVGSPYGEDLLENAFGLGDRIECTDDEIFNSHTATAITDGSRRKAAFDGEGDARMAWIEYFGGTSEYLLYAWSGDENGEGYGLWHSSQYPLRELSYAYGAPNNDHIVFVKDRPEGTYLCYTGFYEGQGFVQDSLLVTDGVENPVIAVDAGGQAHVVFQSTIMGESWLFHALLSYADGIGTMSDVLSGAGAGEPDLIESDGGLLLAYVRDSWLPGWREVCTKSFDGSSWSEAEVHYTGVSVWAPSLAWDRDQRTLLAFLLQNPPGAPLLHTMIIEGGVAQPVRWRPTMPAADFCQVVALDHGEFLLMTQESETGSAPYEIRLRRGDGDVFYPWRRVNSSDSVSFPFIAADFGVGSIAAWWEEYDETYYPFHRYLCWADPGTPVDETAPAAAAGLTAHPNPFNPETSLGFALSAPGWVKLDVYDVGGRHVRRLQDGLMEAGRHARSWDGRDEAGNVLPSGVYFARLAGSGKLDAQAVKLVLVK